MHDEAAPLHIGPVDPASAEALDALRRYYDELDRRFPGGFDPGEVGADADDYRPPHGTFLLVLSGGDVVACGALARIDATTAEIKRMWVHPEWRGAGIGRRLLAALEDQALQRGHRRVLLDTNDTLLEALALYRRNGYQEIPRYNDNPYARHWFEKRLGGDG